MKRWVVNTVVAIIALLVPAVCHATLVDPSTLHIGTGINTPCELGCAGDPNIVSGNVLDIFQTQRGAPGVNNPVLLIIGIANNNGLGNTTSFFSSTAGITATTTNRSTTTTDSVAFATAGTDGLDPKAPDTGASGLFGILHPGQPDVYSFLSLTGSTNNSNSFGNWATADQVDEGVTATSFGIYVFAINEPTNALAGGGLINIKFASALPTGSYAIAYAIDSQHVYDTPFTEAGLVGGNVTVQSVIPEPASLALLGSGLLIVGIRFRRKHAAEHKA